MRAELGLLALCWALFSVGQLRADDRSEQAENLSFCSAETDLATLERCSARLREPASERQQALTLYERGSAHSRLGHYDHALRDLTSAITLWPSYAHAYVARGTCRIALAQFDLAILDLTHALALEPDLRHAREVRAVAWRAKGNAMNALADIAGEIDNARRSLGHGADNMHYRAYGLVLATEYRRAIEVLDDAIAIDASHAEAWLLRGYLHLLLDDPAKAIESYSAAIELLPNDADGYAGRGEAYARLGDPRTASDLEQALTMLADARTSEDLNSRAWILFLLGRHETARPEAALAQSPNDPHFLHTRGRILFALGQREAARHDFDTALRFDPNHTETLAELRRFEKPAR